MADEQRVLSLIAAIRESYLHSKTVYTRGGCYRFHLILKAVFPDAVPIYQVPGHVVTEIDGRLYDITGEVAAEQYQVRLDSDPRTLAEAPSWTFRGDGMQDAIEGKVVYLSGAISSDPEYKGKFDRAAEAIKSAGARICLNPAELPEAWGDYEAYMEHCMLMVRRAEVVVMLPCWPMSPGARAERAYAESLRRPVVDFA